MRGEGMAKRVRGDVLGDVRLLHVAAQDLPGAHAGERAAARIEEENPLPLPLLQLRSELSQVNRGGADGGATDRHEPLLVALAEDAHEPFLEEKIADGE